MNSHLLGGCFVLQGNETSRVFKTREVSIESKFKLQFFNIELGMESQLY